MTTDLTALLAAIVLHPDEDTPRLAYADALMERGLPGDNERALSIKNGVENVTRVWPETFGPWSHRMPQFDGDPVLPPDVMGIYHRGFYTEIETDAATFLRHADALLWHPGQTEVCEGCYNRDAVSVGGGHANYRRSECPVCSGTGRVPRPCPDTAQPIRRVVLTTRPENFENVFVGADGSFYNASWSGVEFELPGTGTTVTAPAPGMSEAEYELLTPTEQFLYDHGVL